jgi:hypothetical protein
MLKEIRQQEQNQNCELKPIDTSSVNVDAYVMEFFVLLYYVFLKLHECRRFIDRV